MSKTAIGIVALIVFGAAIALYLMCRPKTSGRTPSDSVAGSGGSSSRSSSDSSDASSLLVAESTYGVGESAHHHGHDSNNGLHDHGGNSGHDSGSSFGGHSSHDSGSSFGGHDSGSSFSDGGSYGGDSGGGW